MRQLICNLLLKSRWLNKNLQISKLLQCRDFVQFHILALCNQYFREIIFVNSLNHNNCKFKTIKLLDNERISSKFPSTFYIDPQYLNKRHRKSPLLQKKCRTNDFLTSQQIDLKRSLPTLTLLLPLQLRM